MALNGYKVLVKVWDNQHSDYIIAEYDGVLYKDLEQARAVEKKAQEFIEDTYIVDAS